jgi:hypothetical protein
MKTSYPLKLRVSTAPIYLGVYDYLGFGHQVVTKMTGNANYPTPTPTLAAYTAGLDDLQAKADNAVGGGKNAYIARGMSWEASKLQTRELINYVMLNGKNDPDILTSSGFDLVKTGTPHGQLTPPQNLRLSYTGTSGVLKLRMNPVKGVTAGYCLQQAESVTGPWVEIANVSKVREIIISGLTPAKTYYFRACANGALGPSGWSGTASIMAV